jgi:hypothetical protein
VGFGLGRVADFCRQFPEPNVAPPPLAADPESAAVLFSRAPVSLAPETLDWSLWCECFAADAGAVGVRPEQLATVSAAAKSRMAIERR